MIKEAIAKLINKEDLPAATVEQVMDEIMTGQASQILVASYLTALEAKGATIVEITASAKGMRKAGTQLKHRDSVFEIVGTGGDRSNSFNISTTSMFVLAAGGVKVTKHGNRAASSASGAADCLEALGVNIDQPPEKCVRLLRDVGACFIFAQKYHTSMKYVGAIRRELGFRTVFNILGPITNPARPARMLVGVYDPFLVEPLAKVMARLGIKRGMVVHGLDGLDELSISAPTSVCEFTDGWYRSYTIAPEDFNLTRGTKEDVIGGSAEDNARITREVLGGAKGARRDIVLLNAGAALYVGGAAENIAAGVKLAAELIDSGAATKTLDAMIRESNK